MILLNDTNNIYILKIIDEYDQEQIKLHDCKQFVKDYEEEQFRLNIKLYLINFNLIFIYD